MYLRISGAFVGSPTVAAILEVVMVVVPPIRIGDQSSHDIMVPPLGSVTVCACFRMRLEYVNMHEWYAVS